MIKSRGERVSPRETENVLCELPEVAEAAVIGVPDAILGQSIRAYLVLRGDAVLADRAVLRHCAAGLEDFAVPQRVVFRDALPLGNTGRSTRRRFSPKRSPRRSEEHTSELQSLMRISYAVFCLKKKKHIEEATNL